MTYSDLRGLDGETKAKFDAMIGAGIFEGVIEFVPGIEFGLYDNMSRADFAIVLAKVVGLEVDTSISVSSFTDVAVEDPANGYALPYIEALNTRGIIAGTGDRHFVPEGFVTREQLAIVLAKALGTEPKPVEEIIVDKTVSPWAQGYVAQALELNLMSNTPAGTFGGSQAATRLEIVLSSYEADQLLEKMKENDTPDKPVPTPTPDPTPESTPDPDPTPEPTPDPTPNPEPTPDPNNPNQPNPNNSNQ